MLPAYIPISSSQFNFEEMASSPIFEIDLETNSNATGRRICDMAQNGGEDICWIRGFPGYNAAHHQSFLPMNHSSELDQLIDSLQLRDDDDISNTQLPMHPSEPIQMKNSDHHTSGRPSPNRKSLNLGSIFFQMFH